MKDKYTKKELEILRGYECVLQHKVQKNELDNQVMASDVLLYGEDIHVWTVIRIPAYDPIRGTKLAKIVLDLYDEE